MASYARLRKRDWAALDQPTPSYMQIRPALVLFSTRNYTLTFNAKGTCQQRYHRYSRKAHFKPQTVHKNSVDTTEIAISTTSYGCGRLMTSIFCLEAILSSNTPHHYQKLPCRVQAAIFSVHDNPDIRGPPYHVSLQCGSTRLQL